MQSGAEESKGVCCHVPCEAVAKLGMEYRGCRGENFPPVQRAG